MKNPIRLDALKSSKKGNKPHGNLFAFQFGSRVGAMLHGRRTARVLDLECGHVTVDSNILSNGFPTDLRYSEKEFQAIAEARTSSGPGQDRVSGEFEPCE